MARKDKYNKNKPKISPVTLVIVGLVFLALILTIVFSIDTPKQKFNKVNGLGKNEYKTISFKALDKKIEKGDKLIVVINLKNSESSPSALLNNLNDAYYKQEKYEVKEPMTYENEISGHVSELYYVTIKDVEVLDDFFEKFDEIKQTGFPLLLSFNKGEFKAQYKDIRNSEEIENPEALIIRNMELFIDKTTKAFKE